MLLFCVLPLKEEVPFSGNRSPFVKHRCLSRQALVFELTDTSVLKADTDALQNGLLPAFFLHLIFRER